jgi:hypothetical protein
MMEFRCSTVVGCRCVRTVANLLLAAMCTVFSIVATLTSATAAEQCPEWSQLNEYNDLGKLEYMTSGRLVAGANYRGYLKRLDSWALDPLGNWNGHPTGNGAGIPGRTSAYLVNAQPTTRTTAASTDNKNRVLWRHEKLNGTTSHVADCTYDLAGNLKSDGRYFYQYDAWNRLVQINKAIFNPFADPNPTSEDPIDPEGEMWWPGAFVKHFKYDGLGRLIVTQSPYPNPESPSGLRSERFYYDGIRRIQEIVLDPLVFQDDAANSSDPNLVLAAESDPTAQPADPSTSTLQLEEAQTDSVSLNQYLAREYIWGPGDRGIDELLVQYDIYRQPWWMITDAGGDVVAMCSNPISGASWVAAQWTYDAYGAVIDESVFMAGAPVNRCGHKGLFVERLDLGVVPSQGSADSKRLSFGARNYYHVRNRGYDVDLGRWLQSDPNASGLLMLESARFSGGTPFLSPILIDLQGIYGDGGNLYCYLRGSPWDGYDPLGLYDWEEWWDDTKTGAEFLWKGAETFAAFSDPGGLMGAILEALVTNYSMNLESDVEWAMDWRQGEDGSSRDDSSWVQEAIVFGVYKHFSFDYWSGSGAESGGHVQSSILSSTGKSARELAKAYKRLRANMVFDSYYKAKAVKAMKGLGREWEAHHILPYAWAKTLGMNSNGPAVLLRSGKHQVYTTKLNNALRRVKEAKPNDRKALAKRLLKDVYENDPEWWEAIEPMFK